MRTAATAAFIALGLPAASALAQSTLTYPTTDRVDHTEVYHGVSVPDPYRWLEESADDPRVSAWITAQNELTQGYLASLPGREKIKARFTELLNYERFGTPNEEGGRYFFSRNDGLQDQSVLYVMDHWGAEPRVLLDPNGWSDDNTVSLAGTSVSPDGRLIAYLVSDGGSDWRTIKIRDIVTGEDLPDVIEWAKFTGVSWERDSGAFYYSRYDEPHTDGGELIALNENQKLYRHVLGTPQGDDTLVYARPDEPKWGFGGFVTEDGRYLGIITTKGTFRENNVAYVDLHSSAEGATPEIVHLLEGFEADYSWVGNVGSVVYFKTDLLAPLGRVIAIDLENPARDQWLEILPESDATLDGVSMVGGHLIAQYLRDASAEVIITDLSGRKVRQVALPGIGSVGGFGGSFDSAETFYNFTSYTDPGSIYRYNVITGRSELFRRPEVDFNPDDYTTVRSFYSSDDGTRIPIFITHRKGLVADGANPTLLYGYGGFNVSLTPGFSVSRLLWMELGGVYAVACLRGGGEYGKAWHEAGITTKKQNVFDDFIAAAEFLHAERYSSPSTLAIQGGSNGGLLVGACITQRPELFGVALPAVGVMDMLRFDQFTIGWAWRSDYGSPSENEADFRANLAYSPYHNAKAGKCYPPTLITTADRDDRVVPAHSFKFAAAMQAAQAETTAGEPNCASPILIRIETRAGHGAGTPLSKTIEQVADQYAFLAHHLGMTLE